MTLEARDFQKGVGWNVLFLVLGGMAMADVLTTVGAIDWLAGMLTGNVTAGALPWVAGLATMLLTQLGSGAATSMMVSTILSPIADALGYNPTILARIIAGTAQAVAFPWSSPASATTFSFGAVGFGTMFKVGKCLWSRTTPIPPKGPTELRRNRRSGRHRRSERGDEPVTQLNHEKEFERAWTDPSNTRVELPPVDINLALVRYYRTKEALKFTRTMLWKMEVKKAFRPNLSIAQITHRSTMSRT